jgi:hypothetical protein
MELALKKKKLNSLLIGIKKKQDIGRMKANIMLIDKMIELMLGENVEMITEFLGYKPDDKVLNNNQLLEEELENVARQMPDDILMKFYEKSQEKLRTEAEKNYCLQTIEDLLIEMEKYKSKLEYRSEMDSIISILDTAITDIEALKSDIE